MIYVLFILFAISNLQSQKLHTINAGNYYYQPSSLTIEQGDTVMFVNQGGYHDVAVTAGPESLSLSACSGPCTIGILVFNKVGNYDYICTIGSHASQGMVGTIIVNEIVRETANLQIIHNSPYQIIDIYVDGEISLTQIPYRSSTGQVKLSTKAVLGIAPAGEDLVAELTLDLEQSGSYVITAFGIVGNNNKPFNLLSSSLTQNATNDDNVSIKLMHGVTDAPAVDIYANDSLVFENISYGKYSDYINVETNNYTIDVKAHGDDNTVASFDAPLNSYGGRSGIVVASGFLNPTEQDSAFALILATPDGKTLKLPPVKTDLSIQNENSIIISDIYSISNYPNPFNPVTSINYSLAKGSNINIFIYDILGNVVKEVYSGFQTPGNKSINWNATNFKGETVSSGVYFYEIKSNRFRVVKTMMYLK